MEPKSFDFLVHQEVERELLKIKEALRGIGSESYLSFRRLRSESEDTFQSMSESVFRNIILLEKMLSMLKANELSQSALLEKLKEGTVTSREYAEAQTTLSEQQAEFKVQVGELNALLEEEILLSCQSVAALENRKKALSSLAEAYVRVGQQKLLADQIKGGATTMVMPDYDISFSADHAQGFLPDYKDLYELSGILKSPGLKKLPLIGAIYSMYSLIDDTIEGSEKLNNAMDAQLSYADSYWGSFSKILSEAGTAVYNLLQGDWKAAAKNWDRMKMLDDMQLESAESANLATHNQKELNKQILFHTNLIRVNNTQIQEQCKRLGDANLSLTERKELLNKILQQENTNFQYRADDLSQEYGIFKNINSSDYKPAKKELTSEFVKLENYFDTLNKGIQLAPEDQTDLFTTLHKVVSDTSINWSQNLKAEFQAFFLKALNNNEAHRKNNLAINSIFENSNLPRSASTILSTNDEVGIKSNTNSIAEISSKGFAFSSFDTEALRAELAEKKQFYQEDINAYIAYLQEKIAAAKENPAPEGRQEENILKRELGSAERTKDNRLDGLLSQYQGYTTKMTSLTRTYQADMALLNQAMKEAATEEERKRIEEAIDLRSDGYTASLAGLEAEHAGFGKVLFGDLQQMSKEALGEAIAQARDFISKWAANAGELNPETEKVIERIQAGIDRAESSLQVGDGDKTDKMVLAEHFRDAAEALQTCADLAYVFDESLGSVIQTAADVAAGASDIAMGVATFSANPLQGATSILGGVTKIVGSFGKRMQENEQIRKEYLQGLVETYSKELEYNSVLRERLRIQQQLGETSLAYFNRLQGELGKQQGDIDREYTEVWNKLMQEQYISGTGYKHGTWFRKAKTWNEYDSLAGKSYEEMESLYTQDKLEGSAKTLFERLRQLKEEGADVTEMMDQLNQEMKESWTGTTTSAIADSIVQGFLDGKRSAADFADTFEDMMKTAMMQSVKMKYLEGPLDEWYKRFAEASEGGLTEEKIAELRRQYEQIVENAAREAENMEAITGLGTNAETVRQATAQGIASMSQETASELNGNFYALQYLTSNIDRNVTNIQSVLYQASDHWLRIEENTRYCRKLETIERDMASVRKDMQDINNKGILMRTR